MASSVPDSPLGSAGPGSVPSSGPSDGSVELMPILDKTSVAATAALALGGADSKSGPLPAVPAVLPPVKPIASGAADAGLPPGLPLSPEDQSIVEKVLKEQTDKLEKLRQETSLQKINDSVVRERITIVIGIIILCLFIYTMWPLIAALGAFALIGKAALITGGILGFGYGIMRLALDKGGEERQIESRRAIRARGERLSEPFIRFLAGLLDDRVDIYGLKEKDVKKVFKAGVPMTPVQKKKVLERLLNSKLIFDNREKYNTKEGRRKIEFALKEMGIVLNQAGQILQAEQQELEAKRRISQSTVEAAKKEVRVAEDRALKSENELKQAAAKQAAAKMDPAALKLLSKADILDQFRESFKKRYPAVDFNQLLDKYIQYQQAPNNVEAGKIYKAISDEFPGVDLNEIRTYLLNKARHEEAKALSDAYEKLEQTFEADKKALAEAREKERKALDADKLLAADDGSGLGLGGTPST